MTVKCSPFGPKPQFELSSGLPAVGNKLFFYVAGSTTKQNTYTDSTGGSANANPLVLNSLGQTPTEVWFTSGQTYKVVYAPSTDTDPPSSPIWTIDNLTGINDTTSSQDQWVASGLTPTYISATQFSLVGDQTSTFHVGRRIKASVTAGTSYGRITVSAFAAVTTITVVTDGATPLDSGLSAVSYGLLSATNNSFPALIQSGAGVTVSYDTSGRPVIATSGGTLSAIYNYTCQTVALTSISNATPAVMTCTSSAHLPETGSPVQFTTSGTLPTGLSLATTYYVTNPSGSTFNVCTTLADAMAGTNKVATSSAGSGTHTMNSIYVKGSESFIIVEGWGAGGGSGGAGTSNCGAGGGGSGGYFSKKILLATLGSTETITIGAGGTAGAAGGNAGTGATTSFGAHASATGGGGSNGIAASNAITAGGTPGVGSGADINLTGFAGQPGLAGGGAAFTTGGLGGATVLGGVTAGAVNSNVTGVVAKNNSGSGATGASGSGSTAGAIGGSGRVIVYVYS